MSSSSSSNTPCAACKFLRRKCQPDCSFAAYFPPDQPQKFISVHKVFGASNVTKLLSELQPHHREDAVNSLAYEAEMRLRDPVYGCVGVISLLQNQLRQLQMDLSIARSELSKYHIVRISSQAGLIANANQHVQMGIVNNNQYFGGGGATRHQHQHHHQGYPLLVPVNNNYDQHEAFEDHDGGGYDHHDDGSNGLVEMNNNMLGASIRELNDFHQQSSRQPGGDGRPMHPSS